MKKLISFKNKRNTILPKRLREDILQQEKKTDVLISFIQLFLAFLFGYNYFTLFPLPQVTNTFLFTPWILAGYIVFSTLKLIISLRKKLPEWIQYLSILADTLLILSLIWGMHILYEQPILFYLKSHTFIYLLTIISIRSLSFNIKYLLITGISTAIGWAFIVLHASENNNFNHLNIVNENMEFLLTDTLIHSEFDKIISILIVTAVLITSIVRSRKLLIKSIKYNNAAKDLSRFVPEQILDNMINSEQGSQTGQGELTEATILFTDIENFTSIGESIPPHELIDALNEYFTLISQSIQKYGGVICQFQGDAVLASFNTPSIDNEHANSALNAAIDIIKKLEGKLFGSGFPFNTRVGINTGQVVSGLVGSENRVGFTIHGNDVNLAARLEQLNKKYSTQIIVSANTVNRLTNINQFDLQELGDVNVRGQKQSISIYSLLVD